MPSPEANPAPPVRLAELMGSLSLATEAATVGAIHDLGLRAAIVAVGLGRAAGLEGAALSDAFYLPMLRHAGCVGDADIAAGAMGDEVALGRELHGLDLGDPVVFLPRLLGLVGKGKGFGKRLAAITRTLRALPRLLAVPQAQCEVAATLAARFGLGEGVRRGLGQAFERWNGTGVPNRLRGDAISAAARVMHLAGDSVIAHRLGGVDGAVAVVRARAGRGLDPALAERFCASAAELLRPVDSIWQAMLAAEPEPVRWIAERAVDEALRAMGDFADLKSRYTRAHSSRVAGLSAAAATRLGLPDADVTTVRRAGWLHDIGRPSVSAAVWDKPGPLADDEWARIQSHTDVAERVLRRAGALADVAQVACLAHERLDGSGYHRGLPAAALPAGARVLAAADMYVAMTEARPHRPARTPDQAAEELRAQARAGRLDGEAVEAVLGSACHEARGRPERPGGISDRELEVLRLVARGLTDREVAAELGISARTAGHDIRSTFDKIGVTTRAAAALFAMQHDLLDSPAGG